MNKLTFITLNVRGLNSSRKRRAIFRQLHVNKYSIIFLQETYSSTDQEKLWSNEWGSKVYFCHGSKHSKGVAILFNPRLKVLVENEICCENGRILILQFSIDDQKFICANIYAPNNDNAQIIFFKQLRSLLEQFPNDNIIVGGDFNCPLSKTDKEGGRDVSSRRNVASEIEQLMCILDLDDVWRTLHPEEKQFTWRTSDLKIKCRLDYWLIARQLLQNSPVQKCEIKHAAHCDHSLVTLELPINEKYPRGPGFWKFNSSLLEDDEYAEKLMFKIPHFINKYQDLEDHGLLWELIKMEIRAFTISYSKQKAKMKKDYEKDLVQEVSRLGNMGENCPSAEAVQRYIKVKNELDKISYDRARGACVRSKARWHEFGERSSKYFLNLERRNYENKCITSLIQENGSSITDPKEILKEQKRFYQSLYSSQNPQVNDPKFKVFFDNDKVEKLNDEQRKNCEGLLTENECWNALKCFLKNKSPGNDGFTAEFYSFFWSQLGKIMVNSFNYGFHKGELSISQRQSIIRLIPKKNKNLLYLKNWRPISLLNVDYKIASKALALRLKKVLSAVINNTQTGYVEGRFIGENIRLISDILNFTVDQDIEGIALFIDFEKAFDSLEWEYLFKALDTFQFGPDFKTWVKTLYTNISSCIINNGFASESFTLKRGVRQGCPLSGLLFILAAELLSCSIRADEHIKGIRVLNKEIKLSQYADDTTSFCKDKESLGKLLELLDLFKDCSGLKLNQSKSEAMWLGKNANRTDTLFGVQWPQRPISALGISFSYNLKLCEQENFSQKICKIQKLFNIWSQRDLSLYGKITIAKTLGLSKLIFVSSCIHTPPHYIDITNRLITDFVWNNKKPKIKRDTLIGPKERGGLDLPEFETISKSLQSAWVQRMKNGVEDQWMLIPLFYLKNVGGPFIFDCDYDVKFLGLNNLPIFYADVLNTWAEVREQTSDNEICVENVILWNNKHILIDGKSVYWKEWHEAGILRIKDLLDEKNRFLTLNKFLLKTGLKAPFTKLFGLISAIPYRWKCALRPGFIMNNQDMEQNTTKEINVVTSKKVRNILIQRKFVEPLASLRLCRQGLDSSKLSSIYMLPFKITKETKLSIFQYKIVHNILPHGVLLHRMKIVNSPLCIHCDSLETLSHMLVNCIVIQKFWFEVISWWKTHSGECLLFDDLSIMYGYNPEDPKRQILNYYILLGKRHIFLQRSEIKPPSFDHFLEFVKDKLIVQRSIFYSKGQKAKFLSQWKPLLSLL